MMNCGPRVLVPLLLIAWLGIERPLPAEPTDPSARWEPAIRRFEQQDLLSPPDPGGVLFVGSSSIVQWDLEAWFPELDALNRGFGGSQVADVVHFADRVVLPYKPRLILLYAGDNDVAAGKSPERIAADFREFRKLVHAELPDTPIAFLAIKPSPKRWGMFPRMQQANRLIRRMTDEDDRLRFVDVATPMLGSDGKPREELFKPDMLHMNQRGYRIWSELVAPLVEPQQQGK